MDQQLKKKKNKLNHSAVNIFAPTIVEVRNKWEHLFFPHITKFCKSAKLWIAEQFLICYIPWIKLIPFVESRGGGY